ncbi:MAG: GntR family transcriptional regulator [Polyangiales bacterium]
MLDTASPLPLYHQLAEVLLAQIRSGDYGAGHKLPSEHELAAQYGVGRPTVRQATDALIQRGLLIRKRGSGTFVRQVPAQVDLFSLAGTLVSFERGGIALASRLLGRPHLRVVDDATHPLHTREVCHVVRVSSVDGVAVLLEEIDLDARHFPGITRQPLQGRSLSEIVERHYRLRPQSADQSFRVTALDAARAAALNVRLRTPVLQVDRTLHFARMESAIFARMFCRTDRLSFSQRLQGNQHA